MSCPPATGTVTRGHVVMPTSHRDRDQGTRCHAHQPQGQGPGGTLSCPPATGTGTRGHFVMPTSRRESADPTQSASAAAADISDAPSAEKALTTKQVQSGPGGAGLARRVLAQTDRKGGDDTTDELLPLSPTSNTSCLPWPQPIRSRMMCPRPPSCASQLRQSGGLRDKGPHPVGLAVTA